MARRYRMSRKQSRRSYKRGQRVHPRNSTVVGYVRRGGTRL